MSKPAEPEPTAEEEARREALQEFHIARSEALNTYAELERHMAFTFDLLLGTDSRKAFCVFSSVLNTRARLKMLQQLVKLTYPGTTDDPTKYDDFIVGFSEGVGKLDGFRNKLVHWIIEGNHRGEEAFDSSKDIFLADHPDIFKGNKRYLPEILEFDGKAKFFSLLIFYFSTYLRHPTDLGNPDKTPWPEIFQQRPVYPPPIGHQLDRFAK